MAGFSASKSFIAHCWQGIPGISCKQAIEEELKMVYDRVWLQVFLPNVSWQWLASLIHVTNSDHPLRCSYKRAKTKTDAFSQQIHF